MTNTQNESKDQFNLSSKLKTLAKVFAVSALLGSAQARALDVFGYFQFDSLNTTSEGVKSADPTPKQGNFSPSFVTLMMQHEESIYKFFTEIEFQNGAEHTEAPAGGTVDTTPGGEIVVERAYAEMHFHPNLNVVVGKSLSPTLWKANHYPSIVLPVTEPMIVTKETWTGGYTGAMLYGDIGAGFSYKFWFDRGTSSPNGSNAGHNAGYSRYWQFGYDTKFNGGTVAVGVQSGTREHTDTTLLKSYETSPVDLNVNLTLGQFGLWAEYMGGDGSNSKADSGMYAVASYTFSTKNSEKWIPFVLFDQYQQDKAAGVAADLTNGTTGSNNTAFANFGVGVNYKPSASITHKLEYYTQQNAPKSYNQGEGFANGDSQINYQFVFFYN